MIRFVLASASPARRRVFRAAGVDPEVIVSDVDEPAIEATMPEAAPAELVLALATAKARAVASALDGAALVLGCDSMLDLDGRALGKPATPELAAERWREMRGRSGVLRTGHCLIDTAARRTVGQVVSTIVHFADITDEEIALYCATGEPTTVAGAFTIDCLGSWFVAGVEGDHHNVIGVSLTTVRTLLRELGYGLADLGYGA